MMPCNKKPPHPSLLTPHSNKYLFLTHRLMSAMTLRGLAGLSGAWFQTVGWIQVCSVGASFWDKLKVPWVVLRSWWMRNISNTMETVGNWPRLSLEHAVTSTHRRFQPLPACCFRFRAFVHWMSIPLIIFVFLASVCSQCPELLMLFFRHSFLS